MHPAGPAGERVSWDDVGDAIHQAVVRSSGLDPQKVVWKDQDRSAPPADYIALRLDNLLTRGLAREKISQDLTRPPGQEIKIERQGGWKEITLELEAFTSVATSSRRLAALSLASRAVDGLGLPSTHQLLRRYAVSIYDWNNPIQWIPDVPSVNFRGRALATLGLYVPGDLVVEYVGYIARARGTAVITGVATGVSGSSGTALAVSFDSADG